MVTPITMMGGDVGLILLKVLSRFLLTCRRSVKRIRIKQTWGALSFTPTPPGVDRGSKLSNIFVFDLPFSLQSVWAECLNSLFWEFQFMVK